MTPPPSEGITFASLGLRSELLSALETLGYEEPTPIQREAIPSLLHGRDLVGQAGTGTGKTAAFALPLLQPLDPGPRPSSPTALVLVPTRELAVQVSEAVHRYGRQLGARVLPVYGGQPIARQLRALKAGVDVVVATPGRALDHLQRGTLLLSGLRVVVLDEADEMLDMGFAEDIDQILAATPSDRQTVLFSATMPPRIASLAGRHLRNPLRLELGRPQPSDGEALVRQVAYIVQRSHKLAAVGRVLDVEAPAAALIFCRTRGEVDTLTEALNGRGYRADALHGGMGQDQRERVMGRLRSGAAEVLVATDVAARGLDVDTLTHVIHYDVPASPDDYVHRTGRVGRAGRQGVAIVLAEPREHRMLKNIEYAIRGRIKVEKLPSVADLRARRLTQTRERLREALMADDLESGRVVVEALVEEFSLMDIALAGVKLATEAIVGASEEGEEIPDAFRSVQADSRSGPRSDGSGAAGRGGAKGAGAGGKRRGRAGTVNIYLGVGRSVGIRPQDIVGAIANEAGLQGREIGNIEINDSFSLVEIPEAAADNVVTALRQTFIKGKKAIVRREREDR